MRCFPRGDVEVTEVGRRCDSCTVAGTNVGGAKKGFHVVALRDSAYLGEVGPRNSAEVADWCRRIGAQMIGVGAPCRT